MLKITPTCSKAGVLLLLSFCLGASFGFAAEYPKNPPIAANKFAQLGQELPTPGETRLASGAPGPQYWQQRADYKIKVELDDRNQRIRGSEQITYHNVSPHPLSYIWLQLDQNRFKPDSDDVLTATAPNLEELPFRSMATLLDRMEFQGGFLISSVSDAEDEALDFTINKTLMRIDLETPLAAGADFVINVEWQHNIVDAIATRARGGYEYFEADKNYIYEIAQWYPRVVAYTDYEGWNNKQFLGSGEFTLELGDFDVEITVPSDHIVGATGVLQNMDEVLSSEQRKRLDESRTADKPVFIVNPAEAADAQSDQARGKKTWRFRAENVRDFAFASSRKFIWDAMGVKSGDNTVLAMSFYPNEAEPLWSQYSTEAVAHTIEVYSRYSFDYPYPVSISVNGAVGGMEYPMITFNKPRPYEDQTYWDVRQDPRDHTWERSKYGLISVIIHEVGHNYFPMIVNSDERQWTWMDEGLNTFLQFLTEAEWEPDYPSRRGEPDAIVEYMISADQVPIMTNSESILQFGNNAYAKPATALNILRETIMGRELFDFAFREYAQRWKFKRPAPADFFRSMEDASGVDLDWFWRGWFYSTDHVDVSVDNITLYRLDTENPDIDKPLARKDDEEIPQTISEIRNNGIITRRDRRPQLNDFYSEYDEFNITPYDYAKYEELVASLDAQERVLLENGKLFYTIEFSNIGGLITPLPLRVNYEDGSHEDILIPPEIWRRNASKVSKLLITEKTISGIEFDPNLRTADADVSNNSIPRKVQKSRFKLFKQSESPNPMLRQEQDAWKSE